MPIQRVEWTCPGCRRKFAIPATAATPSLCPDCRQVDRGAVEDGPGSRVATGAPSSPAPLSRGERGAATPSPAPIPQRRPEQRVTTQANVDEAEVMLEEEGTIEASEFPLLVDTAPPREVSRHEIPSQRRKRKRPVLRTIAFCWQLLAGLFGLGAAAALLYAIAMAATMDLGPERSTAIGIGIASFIGSGLAAFGALSFASVIQAITNIDEQVRPR